MCTSYLGHPTENPQVGLNSDPLRSPNRGMHSHQPPTSVAATSQRMNHYI
jgi:hypothetical protein